MTCTSQPNETASKFVEGLLNEKLTTDEIVAAFLNVNTVDKLKISQIKTHLGEARKELKSKHVSIKNVKIVSYSEIPERERNIVIDQEDIGKIYFAYYTDKEFIPLLIQNNKVLAFATMDKGGKKYFMEY